MIRVERVPAVEMDAAPTASTPRVATPGLALPGRLEEILKPAERLDRRERAALAATLEARLAPLSPHVAVLDAIRSLGTSGASVVVTGQQPGFLVSPLYSTYKALHALRLAARLREAWGTPVVAVFWNHADDHDVAEAHHTHVVNANLDVQKIALAGLSSGRQPMSRIVLDDATHRLGAIRALLAQLVAGEPFADRALSLFVPRAGESLARAFTRSLTELLGRLGLVVVEPDWIRAEASAHLARVVAADPRLALARGADRIRALGQEPAIDPREAALVYALEPLGRRALRPGGDGFRYDGESGSRTAAELAAEIVQDPLAWSPGALLRPIVQDLCLPVAAYVGGSGELAYHAQLPELRAHVDAPAPAFVPRVSCTLVDPECRASLARLGTSVADVLRARGVFAAEDEGSTATPVVAGKLRAIAERAAGEIASLEEELASLDRTLVPQLERAADGVRSAAGKLAEKVERVHDNKSGKGRRHQRRVTNALCPRGELQERVLGPLPFVARFGEDWIDELLAQIDPLGTEHLVVHLGPDPGPADSKTGGDP